MDRAEARRLLRLALSHREKALTSCEECDRVFAAGAIDQAQQDAVRDKCQAHLNDAAADIARLRKAAQEESALLAEKLRVALDEQKRFRAGARAGRVPPEEADQARQRLGKRIEGLRLAIGEWNRLHGAKTADALGGFIDLPLDRYASEIRSEAAPARAAAVASPRGRFSRRSFPVSRGMVVVSCVALVGLAVSAILVFRVVPVGGEVRFDAAFSGTATKVLRVTCHNGKKVPITLDVPWPEGRPGASRMAEASAQYGIALYVRERAEDQAVSGASRAWHLLPPVEGGWRHSGLTMPAQNRFTLDPGFFLELTLDLRELPVAPTAVRLEFAGDDGRPISTFSADLGS